MGVRVGRRVGTEALEGRSVGLLDGARVPRAVTAGALDGASEGLFEGLFDGARVAVDARVVAWVAMIDSFPNCCCCSSPRGVSSSAWRRRARCSTGFAPRTPAPETVARARRRKKRRPSR